MTTLPWAGDLVRAALRAATTRTTTEPDLHDPATDGDLLGWLGFTPGDDVAGPLLTWPRPARWPTAGHPGPRRRHRVLRPRVA